MKAVKTVGMMVSVGALACAMAWAADAKKHAPKTDTYPLDTCVVSGQKLGAMGDPVKYDYKGREVRFCCQDCIAKFNKAPDKYLAKLDQAAAAKPQAATADATAPEADSTVQATAPATGAAGHGQHQEGKTGGGCGGCGHKSGGCSH